MIVIRLPSKRPKPRYKNHTALWPYQTPSNVGASNNPPFIPSKTNVMFEEAQRRDRIIKQMLAKTLYSVGDIVTPVSNANIDKYGDNCEVRAILQNYGQFGKTEKWPEDDKPYTVHAYSPKLDSVIATTPGFFCLKPKKL